MNAQQKSKKRRTILLVLLIVNCLLGAAVLAVFGIQELRDRRQGEAFYAGQGDQFDVQMSAPTPVPAAPEASPVPTEAPCQHNWTGVVAIEPTCTSGGYGYDECTLCGEQQNGHSIDFEDLDEKLSRVDLMILCNPQNPIGKIWSREDLDKIGELCRKHDVIVISDEIHCDLTDPGKTYNPFRAEDHVIRCLSPSKSFNIAGFQSSIVHTTNRELLEKIKAQLHVDNSDSCNVFATTAIMAAYNDSEEWFEELRQALYDNKQTVKEYLTEELPVVKLVECDATYLLWLDCSALNTQSKALSEFLRQNQGLFLSAGSDFGECGDNFLRMNIACPPDLLKQGLDKLKAGVIALNNINRLSRNI